MRPTSKPLTPRHDREGIAKPTHRVTVAADVGRQADDGDRGPWRAAELTEQVERLNARLLPQSQLGHDDGHAQGISGFTHQRSFREAHFPHHQQRRRAVAQ